MWEIARTFPSSDLGRGLGYLPQKGKAFNAQKNPRSANPGGHFHFTSLLSLTTRILSSPVCVVTVNSKLYAVSNS